MTEPAAGTARVGGGGGPARGQVNAHAADEAVAPSPAGWRWLLRRVCLAAACLVCWVGCEPTGPQRGPTSRSEEAATRAQASADFQVALEFLDNFHQFDRRAALERILYHLQRWGDAQQPDPDWIADPMFGRLPARFDYMKGEAVLSRLRFDRFDVVMLREALWSRDLAQQIRSRALADPEIEDWIAACPVLDSQDQREDLRAVFAIFDWIVRNIQQDAVPDAAAAGQPPPGGRLLPNEALLLGHGDWLVRARIAILMARQLEIPLVMLGLAEEGGEPRPWCLAAFIAGKLFLLDTRLGLPLPDATGRGIATLDALLADPDLLRKLDLPGGPRYPVSASDLAQLWVLIDATPAYLSQRMKLVESRLSGQHKMILTAYPSPLSLELRRLDGIAGVSLWSLPYDAYRYRQQLSEIPPYLLQLQEQMQLVDEPDPLVQALQLPLAEGRRQHFRGVYASSDDERGAKAFYLDCRVPNSVIEQVRDDETTRKMLAANLTPEAAERVLWSDLINSVRARYTTAKQHASYWLGLIAFEEGNYEVAANYFRERTLAAFPEGPWTQGARYNLGRTYQRLFELHLDDTWREKAIASYLSDDASPQSAGNRIRAARLSR